MPKKTKEYLNTGMTEAAFRSFIVSGLRSKSNFWKPKQQCLRNARVSTGKYRCACCNRIVPATIKGFYKTGKKAGKPKRIKNIIADHVNCVISIEHGFQDWNTYISRMFVDVNDYQALCRACHDKKTAEESALRKIYRDKKKE